MKFLSVRDLRGKSASVWRDLPQEREMVVTSNGRPVALLTAVNESNVAESLAAWRQVRATRALASMQQESMKKEPIRSPWTRLTQRLKNLGPVAGNEFDENRPGHQWPGFWCAHALWGVWRDCPGDDVQCDYLVPRRAHIIRMRGRSATPSFQNRRKHDRPVDGVYSGELRNAQHGASVKTLARSGRSSIS